MTKKTFDRLMKVVEDAGEIPSDTKLIREFLSKFLSPKSAAIELSRLEFAHVQPGRKPQRIKRSTEICDACQAKNSFRNRTTVKGVIYAKCKQCGRHAIITLLNPPQPANH